jgi:integrase
VAVFSVQRRSGERNKRPWIVRWSLLGRQRSRAFRTKAEAERYRSALLVAQQSGEAFDELSGEPLSWQPLADEAQAHEWARRWLAEQWPEWAPRTRASAVEALTRLVPLLVLPTAPDPPPQLRAHLGTWLRPEGVAVDEACERWLNQWCLQLGQLNRQLLATVDQRIAVRDDGEPLGPATAGRYRKVSRACIRRAVELGILDVDPWPPVPRGRAQRKTARTKRAIPIRSLPDPTTMAKAIDAIASQQPASRTYQVMTAVAYYAGLRPSEVVMLRARALHLPKKGWGRIDVTEADVSFDEPGEPKTGARSVPIPRQLVDLLQAWVEQHGHAPDDLLFRTRNGRRPTSSNWSRALQRALRQVGYPPLRIYDCRHAAATTWLRAGVPLGEVAKRMGHSVETLVSTYVGALEGDESVANDRIDEVLGSESPRRTRKRP